ncbi:MAG: helix-turn-helix transcriptional regulator [Bacteroidetes bacterium]|nr:helix-turn-helix transcriptional regulator [Bacteroidota bacterium]
MIDRILLILKTQNLSSSQFADEIGVQRSSISHILSGRNNPSLEFVTKILKRFPDINSDWIIFGKGSMYKVNAEKSVSETIEIKKQSLQPNLFNFEESEQVEKEPIKAVEMYESTNYNTQEEESIKKNKTLLSDFQTIKENSEREKNEIKKEQIKDVEININAAKTIKKSIEKILIFYTDKTFREYFPE